MCQALGDSCWENALTVSCSYCSKAITHIETTNQLCRDHQFAAWQQTVRGSFDDGVRNTRVKHASQVLLHFQGFKCTLSCSILPFLPGDPEVRSCHQTRL